jgi:hypothetical protein
MGDAARSQDVHVALAALSPTKRGFRRSLSAPAPLTASCPGIEPIWRQDVYAPPHDRTSFGFKDGISHPAIEGSGIPGTNAQEAPVKAGEFILGYRDEAGELPPLPQPEVLGRNGTYLVFRETAHTGGGVTPVHLRQVLERGRGGAAGRQGCRALAKRRAVGARAGAR